jgi:hypothetical protein
VTGREPLIQRLSDADTRLIRASLSVVGLILRCKVVAIVGALSDGRVFVTPWGADERAIMNILVEADWKVMRRLVEEYLP